MTFEAARKILASKIQERYFHKKLQNLKSFEFTKIPGSLRPIWSRNDVYEYYDITCSKLTIEILGQDVKDVQS